MIAPLSCFVCDKQLENVGHFEDYFNQPYAGTVFTSRGQYGSTVFDPFDGSYLELNICDPCLVERKDRVRHSKEVPTPTTVVYTPWDPTAEDGE